MARTTSTLALAALLSLGSGLGPAQSAGAGETLTLRMDQTTPLATQAPYHTVIVGNPAIADVTVHDETLLLVNPRGFGVTNLLLLDRTGKTVAEYRLRVGSGHDAVSLFKGSARTSWVCAPLCQPVASVGDEPKAFKATAEQQAVRAGGTIEDSDE